MFRQERLGRNKQPFTLLKLRTMWDAERTERTNWVEHIDYDAGYVRKQVGQAPAG